MCSSGLLNANAASSTSALKKEAAVLKDTSLAVLSRELGALDKQSGLMLGMYLNVPNTTIVNIANAASDDGYSDVSDRTRIDTTQKILLTWKDSRKDMRPKIKERKKVKQLARAVTEMGKSEMASVITEKHGENAELTADAFTGLTS
uniref:Death domain-containing protein n=1 Tax=Magallana gigas TaxID=29159 RepID=A0A8W8LXG3_MAGGI